MELKNPCWIITFTFLKGKDTQKIFLPLSHYSAYMTQFQQQQKKNRKYLLNIYYVQGTVQETGDIIVNKRVKLPFLSRRETDI